MPKNLVIVESPAKAKTIEKFLGPDFSVQSSFGHIADLPQRNLAIDIENDYKPQYIIPADKKDLVKKLKIMADKADTVWLASDDDREGEAISWHLQQQLKLRPEKTKRIAFHEITKPAVLSAIGHPREIDLNLVNAQQARRVLDRLVGYEVSPILWKKIKTGLSAGRVQSVAVRLIVEREREIQGFKSEAAYKVSAEFETEGGAKVKAELNYKFSGEKEALEFLEACIKSSFTVSDIQTKPGKRSPSAPFTTSTLQQEAARKLGYGVSQTMSVAQKLYEDGHITYMRTDSMNLGKEAVANIKNEVINRYGEIYSEVRAYHTKIKGAQEAHEAIRPTHMPNEFAGKDERERKLYNLIWKRTIACQMADAKLERTEVDIRISESKHLFRAGGEVLLFDGFMKVYGLSSEADDEDAEETGEGLLPQLKINQGLEYKTIKTEQKYSKAPGRYSEASLVRKLEELGIGRPSTYAPTISTIIRRDYVRKGLGENEQKRDIKSLILKGKDIKAEKTSENFGSDKGRLVPTDMGSVVNDFLIRHFADIVDYKFTAEAEENLDKIALGGMDWVKCTDNFYKTFHRNVEEVGTSAERASGERVLGNDPASGKPVSVRIGRYGAMVQIGAPDDEDKKFASLTKGQSIETISLEDALELFKLPRDLGKYEDKDMTVAIGRFGPYVKWGSMFVSLKPKEGDESMTLTQERAIELIKEKLTAEANRVIHHFADVDPNVYVLNGRFGPYISIDKKNYKIPKDIDPKSLTLEKALKIAKEQPDTKKKKAKK